MPSNWAVAPRVPGPGRGRSREAAAHPPRLRRGAAPSPKPSRGRQEAAGSRAPGKRGLRCRVLEQASTLLPDRRGPAPHPHPHPVFVRGAGGHCVRAGNGGPGNPLPPPPPPRPGPLGNSENTSGVSGGSPAFSLPERPGDGVSEVRPQMRGSFPFPLPLIETLSPIEKSSRGFGSLTRGRYLNRNNNNKKPCSPHRPPLGEFSWLPVGGRERRSVLERGGWTAGGRRPPSFWAMEEEASEAAGS